MKKLIMDRALLRYLLLFYVIAFLLSSASGLLAKWEGIAYSSFGWLELIGTMVLRYLSKLVFILSAFTLVRFLFIKGYISQWMRLLLHGLFAIGLTFYSVFSQVVLNNWFFHLNDELTWEYVYTRALLGTDYNFFLYFSMSAIVYAYYYFKKQKDYLVRESKLNAQLLDAKLNALQGQLQPHFLFNTLNDISSLIDGKPALAQDCIADLCDMLRETLRLNNTKFISLEEELRILRKYLDIEKVRFDEKLSFELEVADSLLNENIPPLILQPIVENSIAHGFSYEHDTLKIRIQVRKEEDFLKIVIDNNGQSLKKDLSYGIGLSNVLNRLETLYPTKFEFDMENNSNGTGVVTTLALPRE